MAKQAKKKKAGKAKKKKKKSSTVKERKLALANRIRICLMP